MSILSGTLTRCYMRATENSQIFVIFFFSPLGVIAKLDERAPREARSRPSRHRPRVHREIALTRYHPVPLYPATTSIDLPGTNRSLSPRRTVRFLVMLREKSFRYTREYAVWITAKCDFLLEGTVSFLLLAFPPPSLSLSSIFFGKHKPALDQRHARRRAYSRRERGFSALRL